MFAEKFSFESIFNQSIIDLGEKDPGRLLQRAPLDDGARTRALLGADGHHAGEHLSSRRQLRRFGNPVGNAMTLRIGLGVFEPVEVEPHLLQHIR